MKVLVALNPATKSKIRHESMGELTMGKIKIPLGIIDQP